MKRTIKYLALAAIVAATALSCTKEADTTDEVPTSETPSDPQDEDKKTDDDVTTNPSLGDYDPAEYLLSFGATFENQGDGESKLTVSADSGTLAFEDGDEVLVYCPANGGTGTYVYSEVEGAYVFAAKSDDDVVAVGDNYAYVYYPVQDVFTVEESGVTFTMPSAVEESELGGKLPMAGIITSGSRNVTFKNLGSILRARFNSSAEDGETITAVELSVEGADITGSGTVSWNSETNTPEVTSLEGGKTVSVTTDAGHLTSESYKDFYFFLPASGSLTAMTIKAVYGKTDGENSYSPYESIRRTSTLTLARNKIYKVQKTLSGFFSGGDGSESYPYVISTADDFKAIATLANYTTADDAKGYSSTATRTFFGSAGVHYQQTADIDFEDAALTKIGTNASKPFCGVYDAQKSESDNYKLSNYSVSAAAHTGLFAALGTGAAISNLDLNNATVEASGNNAGFVAGSLTGGSEDSPITITNVNVTGTSTLTSSGNAAGGILGYIYASSYATIDGADVTANITSTGTYNVGGILGNAAGAYTSISNCTVSGKVSGKQATGGIAGLLSITDGGTLSTCTNYAIVQGEQGTGGIVGFIASNITSSAAAVNATLTGCTNNGAVSGTNRVGGIVGSYNSSNNMNNCVNTVGVTGTQHNVGGLVGYKRDGNIYSGCKNSGRVEGLYNVGGLVGYQTSGAIQHNGTSPTYNEGEVVATGKDSNNNASAGGIVGYLAGGTLGNANLITNSGKISVTDGYAIGGIIGYMSSGTVTACANNIDIEGINQVGGVVGYMNDGTVDSCINNKNVTASGNSAGGIVGDIRGGMIKSCYSAGSKTIKGTHRVGGLAGYQSNQGAGASVIINSASKSNVTTTGTSNYGAAGGLVGYMYSANNKCDVVLANCVALASTITASGVKDAYLGAIVGLVNGAATLCTVRNCYSQHTSTNKVHSTYGGGDFVQESHMGGIFGYLMRGNVYDCYCVGSENGLYSITGSNKSTAYAGCGTYTTTSSYYAITNSLVIPTIFKNGSPVNLNSNTIALTNGIIETGSGNTLKGFLNDGTKTSSSDATRISYASSAGNVSLCAWTCHKDGSNEYAYPTDIYKSGYCPWSI